MFEERILNRNRYFEKVVILNLHYGIFYALIAEKYLSVSLIILHIINDSFSYKKKILIGN